MVCDKGKLSNLCFADTCDFVFRHFLLWSYVWDNHSILRLQYGAGNYVQPLGWAKAFQAFYRYACILECTKEYLVIVFISFGGQFSNTYCCRSHDQ